MSFKDGFLHNSVDCATSMTILANSPVHCLCLVDVKSIDFLIGSSERVGLSSNKGRKMSLLLFKIM